MSSSYKRQLSKGIDLTPTSNKFNHERLDAVKTINSKITAIDEKLNKMNEEIIKNKPEVTTIDIQALILQVEQLRGEIKCLEVDDKLNQLKDDIYTCIEEYIVSSTPRLSVNSEIEDRLTKLEQRLDKQTEKQVKLQMVRSSHSVDPVERRIKLEK